MSAFCLTAFPLAFLDSCPGKHDLLMVLWALYTLVALLLLPAVLPQPILQRLGHHVMMVLPGQQTIPASATGGVGNFTPTQSPQNNLDFPSQLALLHKHFEGLMKKHLIDCIRGATQNLGVRMPFTLRDLTVRQLKQTYELCAQDLAAYIELAQRYPAFSKKPILVAPRTEIPKISGSQLASMEAQADQLRKKNILKKFARKCNESLARKQAVPKRDASPAPSTQATPVLPVPTDTHHRFKQPQSHLTPTSHLDDAPTPRVRFGSPTPTGPPVPSTSSLFNPRPVYPLDNNPFSILDTTSAGDCSSLFGSDELENSEEDPCYYEQQLERIENPPIRPSTTRGLASFITATTNYKVDELTPEDFLTATRPLEGVIAKAAASIGTATTGGNDWQLAKGRKRLRRLARHWHGPTEATDES